jgi:phage tail protein X
MAKYINSLLINRTTDGKKYYSSALPTNYDTTNSPYRIVSDVGDRWDTLAYRYFGDAKYWYAIALANGQANGSIFIKPGTEITIPEVI